MWLQQASCDGLRHATKGDDARVALGYVLSEQRQFAEAEVKPRDALAIDPPPRTPITFWR